MKLFAVMVASKTLIVGLLGPTPFLLKGMMKLGSSIMIVHALKTTFILNTHCHKRKEPSALYFVPGEQPYTQVIADVDDTLKSSGGVKIGDVALGGIDTQYERDEFYPGVFEFLLQLSVHSLPSDTEVRPAKVAVLTARAEEFKAALQLRDDSELGKALKNTGEASKLKNWGLGPVLYGSVCEWVLQDRKGLRKFANFERLMQQDPSGTIMQYVYVGDTGELDQEAGETMLREYPELVKAVFLHVVSGLPSPRVPSPRLINGRPVVFFRTYVGAAARATQLGLMSENGLVRVVSQAKKALSDVPRLDSKWVELEVDIKEACRTLRITYDEWKTDELKAAASQM